MKNDQTKQIDKTTSLLGPRNRQAPATTQQGELHERCWAVIAVHYVSCDLTHAEALAEAKDLQTRNQPGVTIVTNEVAYRLFESQPESSKLAA